MIIYDQINNPVIVLFPQKNIDKSNNLNKILTPIPTDENRIEYNVIE